MGEALFGELLKTLNSASDQLTVLTVVLAVLIVFVFLVVTGRIFFPSHITILSDQLHRQDEYITYLRKRAENAEGELNRQIIRGQEMIELLKSINATIVVQQTERHTGWIRKLFD